MEARKAKASYERVLAIALAEMTAAAPLPGSRVMRALLNVPASALAASLVALDSDLAGGSLRRAALRRLAHYGVSASIDGKGPVAEHAAPLPTSGPLVVVSNHPGLFDALVLFASIAREDLATLAARRPLLDALPNVKARLLTIDEGPSGFAAIRAASRHLRNDGALLHFPAGSIEPDPRSSPDAISPWKQGLDAILKTRPGELVVATALVSGVIARRARFLSRLIAPNAKATDALIPLLQLTFRATNDASPIVRFGPPRPASSVTSATLHAELSQMAREALVTSAGRA